MNFKEGEVLCFDKPLTWTSFAVVNKIRYHLCRRMGVKKLKVGHAGTLDPLATGVMIICTGKATKRIEEFQYHTKEYVATLMLGATTPSYDLEKEIDATYPTEHITRELVEETLQRVRNDGKNGRGEALTPRFGRGAAYGAVAHGRRCSADGGGDPRPAWPDRGLVIYKRQVDRGQPRKAEKIARRYEAIRRRYYAARRSPF